MKTPLVILGLATALAAFVFLTRHPVPTKAPVPADTRELHRLSRLALAARMAADERAPHPEPSTAGAPPAAPLVPTATKGIPTRRLMRLLEGELPAHLATLEEQTRLLHELADRFRRDPRTLRRGLAAYVRAARHEGGGALARALALSGDPIAAEHGLALASSSRPEERDAGFRLLDAIDPQAPEVRRRLLELARPDEPSPVQLGVLHALENPVDDPVAVSETMQTFEQMLRHPDDDVRREAYIAIGRWANTPEQLMSLVAALSGDDRVVVKIGVAYALGEARVQSPEVIAALSATLRDDSADLMLRYHAYRALTKRDVDPDTAGTLQSYRDLIKSELQLTPEEAALVDASAKPS